MLSNFFFVLAIGCLLSLLYFVVGVGKPGMRFVGTRKRAEKFAGLSLVAFLICSILGASTMTPAQRREMEERKAAREVARQAEQAEKARTAVFAPKEGEALVSQQDYGDKWPFTVENGFLSCVDEGLKLGVRISSVLFRTGNTVHGLNGTARDQGYPAPTSIRKTQSFGSVQPITRLPEAKRRSIFANVVACEDANPSREASQSCKAKLRQAEKLSADELRTISYEGTTAGWPPLDPTYMDVQPVIAKGLSLCVEK